MLRYLLSTTPSALCGHTVLMGKKKHKWQDTKYVLSYFGKKVSESRKGYLLYVKKGIDQGRRPELTGGGLVRSLGGWSMIKKLRLKGQKTISELASEYGVHANQISRWKKQLLDASPDIFTR